jgi:cyclopropane fatty-acyl-phospholipid synthase-like methyltransferase
MSQSFVYFEDLLRAYRKSRVIFSAFELKIFENLARKARTINQLHKIIDCDPRGLQTILDALQAMKLVQKTEDSYVIIPELTPYLDPSSEYYCGGQIAHEIFLAKRWEHLTDSIRTGNPAKKTDHPESAESINRFISAMSELGQRSARLVVDKIPFGDKENILDLGGGPGRYMEAFISAFPSVKVTLFDQPETITAARHRFHDHPDIHRINFIAGDFFDNSFGNQYDTIFLSNIIHIFGPEGNRILLKKCRDHLVTAGRMLIKDMFLDDNRGGPLNTTLFALHMHLSTKSGKCYSIAELKSILKSVGFIYKHKYSLTKYSSVIEAQQDKNLKGRNVNDRL